MDNHGQSFRISGATSASRQGPQSTLGGFCQRTEQQHHPGPSNTTQDLPTPPRTFQHHPGPPSTTHSTDYLHCSKVKVFKDNSVRKLHDPRYLSLYKAQERNFARVLSRGQIIYNTWYIFNLLIPLHCYVHLCTDDST